MGRRPWQIPLLAGAVAGLAWCLGHLADVPDLALPSPPPEAGLHPWFASKRAPVSEPLATQPRPRSTAQVDQDWSHLDPDFAGLAHRLFQEMAAQGYPLVLLEGYRSPERQTQLAALGPQVTRAVAGQSRHQWGLAMDVGFLRNGVPVIAAEDPWAAQGYVLLGTTAKRLGLRWGGTWALRDLGHVEAPGPLPRT